VGFPVKTKGRRNDSCGALFVIPSEVEESAFFIVQNYEERRPQMAADLSQMDADNCCSVVSVFICVAEGVLRPSAVAVYRCSRCSSARFAWGLILVVAAPRAPH
jgi:hypothetical protein